MGIRLCTAARTLWAVQQLVPLAWNKVLLWPEEHLGVELDHKQVIVPLDQELWGHPPWEILKICRQHWKQGTYFWNKSWKWLGSLLCGLVNSYLGKSTRVGHHSTAGIPRILWMTSSWWISSLPWNTGFLVKSSSIIYLNVYNHLSEKKLKHHQKAYPALHISTSGP